MTCMLKMTEHHDTTKVTYMQCPRAPPVPIDNQKVFSDVVREVFSHRRKTLSNCLKGLSSIYGKEKTASFIASCDKELLQKRPEVLSVAEFIELSNSFAAHL